MIEFKSVSKTYGKLVSLRDISFGIKKGEIFGLLGPNGAGKSTTVNILNTLIRPDSGEILIKGLSLYSNTDRCKMMMGVVPQEIALYENISAFDNLLFWGSLYGVPKIELKKNATELLELVGLSSRKNDKIKTFSGGMKRRINIACSLLHRPEILILDEPTAGVDPQNRNHIFDLIENLNSNGITVVYTTHYMEEAERLCDSIAIIDAGIIRACGTLDQLRDISGARDIVSLKITDYKANKLDKAIQTLQNNIVSRNNGTIKMECDNVSKEIASILKHFKTSGIEVSGFDAHEANLESVFLRLTGKNLRD